MDNSTDSDVLVTLRHCQMVGFCIPAVKSFCKEHDVDWTVFKKGVKASYLEKYNLSEFDSVILAARNSNGK